MVAVFASVAAEAGVRVWSGCVVDWCVFVVGWCMFVMCMFVMMIVVGDVWWLDGDLHGHWSLLVNGEGDVLLVDDWSIDWNVDGIGNWLLDDVRNLLVEKVVIRLQE